MIIAKIVPKNNETKTIYTVCSAAKIICDIGTPKSIITNQPPATEPAVHQCIE